MRSLTRTQPLWGHDLGLLASRNVRIKFRWFISFPVCGILVTAAQTDYESEERQSKHMLFCSTTEEIPKGENKLINPSKIFNWNIIWQLPNHQQGARIHFPSKVTFHWAKLCLLLHGPQDEANTPWNPVKHPQSHTPSRTSQHTPHLDEHIQGWEELLMKQDMLRPEGAWAKV